ncbi:MAG TPA: tetratricopeptide repeat protein, partial [Gemmataceae bacterium]
RVADRFPDGQLYVNLHGATQGLEPLDPLEALSRFLRALGLHQSAIPATLEEAAARYRSVLADRRILVLLDNARDSTQVRPLLPGTATCGVLITSRTPLWDLDGAHHVRLGVLSPAEGMALLTRLAGPARIAAEPDAAAQAAQACGYLPLALRIVGARLAARPTWTVRVLADRLADQHRRLDELALRDLAVRASFQVSLQSLPAGTDLVVQGLARAFCLLALLDGPDFGLPVAAALLGQPPAATEAALERLVDEQLIEQPRPGRYRFHDLLGLFAREQARQWEPAAERQAAHLRALRFYLATAERASGLLAPGDRLRSGSGSAPGAPSGLPLRTMEEALAWLDTERANLMAAARQAASGPADAAALVPRLAMALYWFFRMRWHLHDWEAVNLLALQVTRRLGDRHGEGQILNDLGVMYSQSSRLHDALDALTKSLRLRREVGDRRGEGMTLSSLGAVYGDLRRLDAAIACLELSCKIQRASGDRHAEAVALNNLGISYMDAGRLEDALACHERSLALRRELGDRYGEALDLVAIGDIHRRLGHLDEAARCC